MSISRAETPVSGSLSSVWRNTVSERLNSFAIFSFVSWLTRARLLVEMKTAARALPRKGCVREDVEGDEVEPRAIG
jgi:hypothetical protein